MEPEPSGLDLALIILVSLLAFCLIWLGVIFLLSELSGWRSLAVRYSAGKVFSGQLFRLQSGQMRWVGINRCLNIGANREGLHLSMLPVFAIFHAPLFVPWRDIAVTPKNKLIRKGIEFRLGRDPGVPLWLETRLAERLRESAP